MEIWQLNVSYKPPAAADYVKFYFVREDWEEEEIGWGSHYTQEIRSRHDEDYAKENSWEEKITYNKNDEKTKILPHIKTYSELKKNNLDFRDTLIINNEYITDKTETDKNLYGLKIPFYPITRNDLITNDAEKLLSLNRLYIFEKDNQDNPERYSFRIAPIVNENQGAGSFWGGAQSSSNNNDYVLYLKWSENWHLRRHIDDNQFKIVVPEYFVENSFETFLLL